MTKRNGDLTKTLMQAVRGDPAAEKRLFPKVYEELRAIARERLRHERRGHTLQATDLAHEAYLRLIDQTVADSGSRVRFLAIAAEAIRRVLVDHARARAAAKRGGGKRAVTLADDAAASIEDDVDLVALDEALEKLREEDERLYRCVELRFFGGLTEDEVAEVLNVSRRTVCEDWRLARAILHRWLS
ncbi:MAG: ECF-type sigma factor [Planctomycetota bacterium]